MKLIKVKKKDSTASDYFYKYSGQIYVNVSNSVVLSKLISNHINGLDSFNIDDYIDDIETSIDKVKELLKNLEKVEKELLK